MQKRENRSWEEVRFNNSRFSELFILIPQMVFVSRTQGNQLTPLLPEGALRMIFKSSNCTGSQEVIKQSLF